MKVEEGRLEEAGGARRAFGTVEGVPYALGWDAGAPRKDGGRLTLGLRDGAVHVRLRRQGDEWAMAAIDEPFERLGGPDLSRREVLARGDVERIWALADAVVEHDHRAWWMRAWLGATSAYVTRPVYKQERPVVGVVHDEDGDWQLLCGTAGKDEDADDVRVMHLHEAVDRDPSLAQVLDLEVGQRADRRKPGGKWKRRAA